MLGEEIWKWAGSIFVTLITRSAVDFSFSELHVIVAMSYAWYCIPYKVLCRYLSAPYDACYNVGCVAMICILRILLGIIMYPTEKAYSCVMETTHCCCCCWTWWNMVLERSMRRLLKSVPGRIQSIEQGQMDGEADEVLGRKSQEATTHDEGRRAWTSRCTRCV